MRFVLLALVWLSACRALAQAPEPGSAAEPRAPAPAAPAEPTAPAPPAAEPRAQGAPAALAPPAAPAAPAALESVAPRSVVLPEPGTRVAPSAAPAVGSCLGGSCALGAPAMSEDPRANVARRERRSLSRPGRFAYAGAIVGTVSAGLLLAGSVAIAVADNLESERVTRGIWFSELALATPLVALSAFTARRGSSFHGYRGLRNLGWVAYGAAVTDGILLWYAAFQDTRMPPALTIAAGAIASFALLPHALDALVCARKARSRSTVAWAVTPRGLGVSF